MSDTGAGGRPDGGHQTSLIVKVSLWLLIAVLAIGVGLASAMLLNRLSQPSPAPALATENEQAPDVTDVMPGAARTLETGADVARVETFGNWGLFCSAGATETEPCLVQQQLTARGDASERFVWTIYRGDDGNLRSVWTTPPNADSDAGFIIDLGNGEIETADFSGCDAVSCSVRGILSQSLIDRLIVRDSRTVAYKLDGANEPIRAAFDTAGLEDAIAEL